MSDDRFAHLGHVENLLSACLPRAASLHESIDSEPSGEAQSIQRALSVLRASRSTRSVMEAFDDQLISLAQSVIAEKQLPAPTGLEVRMDEHDYAGWALSVLECWRKPFPHPWYKPDRKPTVLAADCRIALVGDWGTGAYGAPHCASAILSRQFDLVIHLGDVYYSGTEYEVEHRFVSRWPMRPGQINRAINANHEMYSGGYGYYKHILPAFQQASSCFALQNDEWLILGLDTAYQWPPSTHQLGWLDEMVAGSGSRQLILLTHHYPFSSIDGPGLSLLEHFRAALSTGRVALWYWGHEHRCVFHDRHVDLGFLGRCIGHGGMPYSRPRPNLGTSTDWIPLDARDGTPRGALLDGPNEHIPDQASEYGPNGFLGVTLQGRSVTEEVYLANGTAVEKPAFS